MVMCKDVPGEWFCVDISLCFARAVVQRLVQQLGSLQYLMAAGIHRGEMVASTVPVGVWNAGCDWPEEAGELLAISDLSLDSFIECTRSTQMSTTCQYL